MKIPWLLIVICLVSISSSSSLASDLHGQVVDQQGQPVAGARIDVATAAPKVGRGIFCPSCYLDCRKWTRSDDKGQFVIKNLSPKLKFRILSTAPEKQTRLSDLFDPDSGPLTLMLADFPEETPDDRILMGEIVSAEGVPIPGALIEPYGGKTGQRRWWGTINAQSTVSDDDGKFKMLLGESFQGVDVMVSADERAGTRGTLLTPGPGLHRIVVPEGARVTGKLVHNGEPQAGVEIAVVQTNRGAENHFIKAVSAVTNEHGVFHFRALPASQQYAIFSPVGQRDGEANSETRLILPTKTFQVPDDGKTRDVGTLELATGFDLAGKLVMTDGKPLPGGIKVILGRDPAWDLVETPVGDDGQFAFRNVPTETYDVTVMAKGIQLDASRLKHQATRANAIGIRLKKSIEDLVIPLQPESEKQPPAPVGEKRPPKAEATITEPEPAVDLTWVEVAKTERPEVEFTEEPVPEDGPKLSARGIVRTPQGERLSGATVILRAKLGGTFYAAGVTHNRDILAQTTTDSQGQFVLDQIPIPLRMVEVITGVTCGRGGAEVVAFSAGTGISWANVSQLVSAEPLQFVLEPQAECRGVVRDEDGHGIPRARVELWGITSNTRHYDDFLRGPTDISFTLSQLPRTVFTDDAGQFSMDHVPVNRRSLFVVTADGFARQVMMVDTANRIDQPRARVAVNERGDKLTVLRSPMTVALKPQAFVTITVFDHTGRPVDGGVVQARHAQQGYAGAEEVSSKGEARLSIRSPGRCTFFYAADPLSPRPTGQVELEVNADDGNQEGEIRLPETRWLTGRVVSDDGEHPVCGTMVMAMVIDEDAPIGKSTVVVSDAQGEFRIPVVPGRVRCRLNKSVYGYDRGEYRDPNRRGDDDPLSVEAEIPVDGEIAPVTLTASRGLIVEGTVLDSAGAPVPRVPVLAEHIARPYQSTAAFTDEQGRFQLAGISPRTSTVVTASTGIAADRLVVEPKSDVETGQTTREKLILVLKPAVQLTGRVVQDGEPVAGVTMELLRSLPGAERQYTLFAQTQTDREGRYVVGGLSPGDHYEFRIVARQGLSAPDWQHQSPYVQQIPEDHVGKLELPDANLVMYQQSLSGKVVDPDGNPVAGFTVSAGLANGRSLSRRDNIPPPWTESDESGSFQLEQLPDEPIELMAYKRNPAGGLIHYPVRLRPEWGDDAIRIVVDPALHEGVEDLDKR